MEVFSFKNVLHVFYQSNYEKMSIQWRKNKLGKGDSEAFSLFQVQQYLMLMNDKIIQEFLEFDRCYKLADKYLLSMVFVYFVRAKLPLSEYTRKNFFAALYLAHDIEEDDEDLKVCFIAWGLGVSHRKDFDYFMSLRNKIWEAMDYRACVSLKTCHEIMESIEASYLWERERDPAHGGAIREYDPNQEKCKRCCLLDESKRFYWSDYEFSFDSDSEEGSDESSSPPAKKLRINEE